jgi:glycine/D-amino acid oxidase-like deaminating enzyme
METHDWIVIGGGLAGSALGYELANLGFSVLLLEQEIAPQNATRFSYGGIAYWSGTTAVTRQLCQEGIELHRNLSTELESDTEFREIDLLLTIPSGQGNTGSPECDPAAIADLYASYAIPPQLISAAEACELEPLLKPEAIAAALHGCHGHVSPELMTQAYQQAMVRLGGEVQLGRVVELIKSGQQVLGVATVSDTYEAANVVVCAGGMSRALLRSASLPVRLYFTQAELVETPPLDLQLRTLVSPASLKRFQLEEAAGRTETDALWNDLHQEITAPILDVGVVQLKDGRLRMGQISRTLTNPNAQVNSAQSEAKIRDGVGQLLPALYQVPGQWQSCLVSFSSDRLPLIGALPGAEGIYIFSGFSSPFAMLPPLARRFARHLSGQADEIIDQMSPNRFAQAIES